MWIAVAVLLVLALMVASHGLPILRTWVAVRRSTSERTQVEASQVSGSAEGKVEIEVHVATPRRTVSIVGIEVERGFHNAVGLGRPDGFRYDPYEAGDGEVGDDDDGEPALPWHEGWVRYSGDLSMTGPAAIRIVIPVREGASGAGDIRLRYAELVGIGGAFLGLTVVRARVGR